MTVAHFEFYNLVEQLLRRDGGGSAVSYRHLICRSKERCQVVYNAHDDLPPFPNKDVSMTKCQQHES